MVQLYIFVCMSIGNIFSRGGATSGFFQTFLQGGEIKSDEICFLPLETQKADFCWNFQFCARRSNTHDLV